MLAHVGKTHKPVVSAVVKTVFAEKDGGQSRARRCEVADSLRDRFRDVAELMDETEHDVLVYMALAEGLRSKKGSSGAPTSSGSFRPVTPSSAWSARSCSTRTTSGPSPAATCRRKR